LTALLAAIIAITQTDIKKVLAYSTVSQLGYMFIAAGCGGYTGAIFHLVTHAFFKALLFLGAGSVILAMHHEQDIGKMGGLRRKIPQTTLVFAAGVVAISGFPPFSGFFSKDEILVAAFTSHVPGHLWLYAIGLFTAGITAFYMWRLFFLTFWGESRVPAELRERIREPSGVIVNPLWVLAVLALVGGLIGVPQIYGEWFVGPDQASHSLNNFLEPLLPAVLPHQLEHSTEWWMAVAAVFIAAAGQAAAYVIYVRKPNVALWLASNLPTYHRLATRKFYVDEIYDHLIVRPLVRFSDAVLFRRVDAGLIDGIAVNGTARGVRATAANGLKYLQSGLTQGYVFMMIVGTVAILGYMLG
jgi:NADH-quinone oxidoreductase subunit L